MLRQRVITASLLAPLVIAGVLLLPTIWLGILLALILIMAAQEWAKFAGLTRCGSHVGFVSAVGLIVLGLGWLLASEAPFWPLFLLAAFWWLWTSVRLTRVAEVAPVQGTDRSVYLTGLLVLPATWAGLVWTHQLVEGPQLLLSLLLLIWGADIAAYFAGRRWGRHKLAPALSPGKTREGVFGAMSAGLLVGLLLSALYARSGFQGVGLLLLCLILVPLSVVGDLYESLLKRKRGLKDSGNLLPGHGGVMDRIDSLTAAAPVFALGLWLLGVGT